MEAERRDRSVVGCARPAPGIAVDPDSGYVHVVYHIVAPEGPGVFFSHAMRMGAPMPAGHAMSEHAGHDMSAGMMWHAPVPIVYGERPSAAAVAVHGNAVVVAYEDPNSGRVPRIALAISRTQGHIFEERAADISGAAAAAHPLAAVRGSTVAVAWRESERPRELVVRVGRMR